MGTAYTGKERDVQVVVYDISMRGISFAMEREAVFRIGDEVTITFQEKERSRHLVVQATVVRKFSLDEFEAVGCRMHDMGTDVLAFIKKVTDRYTNGGESQDQQ